MNNSSFCKKKGEFYFSFTQHYNTIWSYSTALSLQCLFLKHSFLSPSSGPSLEFHSPSSVQWLAFPGSHSTDPVLRDIQQMQHLVPNSHYCHLWRSRHRHPPSALHQSILFSYPHHVLLSLLIFQKEFTFNTTIHSCLFRAFQIHQIHLLRGKKNISKR